MDFKTKLTDGLVTDVEITTKETGALLEGGDPVTEEVLNYSEKRFDDQTGDELTPVEVKQTKQEIQDRITQINNSIANKLL